MPGAPLSQAGSHAGLLAVSFCSPRTERVRRVPPTLPSAPPSEGRFCRNPHCAQTGGQVPAAGSVGYVASFLRVQVCNAGQNWGSGEV